VLSAQAIATLRGITAQSAEAELRDAGIVPREPEVIWADANDLPPVDLDLAALDDDLGPTLDHQDRTVGPQTP
jgi:hypothetical protein